MRAVIYEVPGNVGIGWLDIAGRPLLVRQAQWLRDAGIEDLVVEVCAGPDDASRGAWLLSDDPLVVRTQVIPSASPLGPDELSRRAGIPADERVLQIPAQMLCGGPLDLSIERSAQWQLSAPVDVHARSASFALKSRSDLTVDNLTVSAGWGVCIDGLGTALDASCAILDGRAPGIIVHALEQSQGVWIARGAHVDSSARIEAPAYLGVDALVLAGAQIGPRAVILDHAVIERGASVIDGCVGPSTLVGEGARIRRALATSRALLTFDDDDSRSSIFDRLVLASRTVDSSFSVRVVAILPLLILLFPWLLCALWARIRGRDAYRKVTTRSGPDLHVGSLGIPIIDQLPAFLDVLLGARDLIGVGRTDLLEIAARRPHALALPRAGAIDISRRIAPGHGTNTALRMWRWYARRKNSRFDRALLGGRDPAQ